MADRVVTAVEVVGDDNVTSHKTAKHVGKGMLKMLIANKRPGSHVRVHYNEGSPSQHLLQEPDDDKKKAARPATFRIELPEGVEP